MTTLLSPHELFEKRYPQLAFLLHVMQEEPWTFCEEGKNGTRFGQTLYEKGAAQEERERAFSHVDLGSIEVLYIYGLGLGDYAMPILDWLEKDPKRDLVFIEEDLEVVRLFLQSENASLLLSHPQIHLRLMMESKQWKPFLDACASEFPYEHVELVALSSLKRASSQRFSKMRLHLLRRSTVHHAILMDDSYYHVLSKNVLRNFSQIDGAFYANRFKKAFQNVPAVICGAGPSLQEELETLRTLEDKALLFAGGSAIAALSRQGILPHFGVAIDPNHEEVHRFQQSVAFETPLLYTNRLHPDVFATINGPRGYIHAKTGGPLEAWWEEKRGIEPLPLAGGFDIEALSVTTTALELAVTMGCSPIILVGVDLAYTKGALYASGIVENPTLELDEKKQDMRVSERLLKRKDREGKEVYTLVKWVMESDAIARFAKKNRSVTFINATAGGIGFAGLPFTSLASLSLPFQTDLRGRIHELIETHRFSFDGPCPLETLCTSLKEAEKLTNEAICELERLEKTKGDPEKGRLIFYQMELEALEAYTCCLEQPAETFAKTFARQNRSFPFMQTEEELLKEKRAFHRAKWNSLNDLIMYYLESLFTK